MLDLALEGLLKRDRAVVMAALVTVTALAWIYVARLAHGMDMGGMDMTGYRMVSTGLRMAMAPAARPWSQTDFLLMFAMWTVMMIGMMTPSVAPLLLLYARVARKAARDDTPMPATAWFAAGYLLAWTAFALGATILQRVLESAALLTPAMGAVSGFYGGAVLLVAGAYQWSSLKHACLEQCESPLVFLQRHGGFQRTASGSCALGLRHGMYCVGCCWVLMLLLFVGGVMALPWIAAISMLVLVEKVSGHGRVIARLSGAAFMIGGVSLLVAAR